MATTHAHTRAYLVSILPPSTGKKLSDEGGDGDLRSPEEDPSQAFIDLLSDEAVAEDDRPDALKDLLAKSMLNSDADQEEADLDSLVLSLLHRHREDVAPTGQTFDRPPTPLRQAPLSRSSSFKRMGTPTLGSRRVVSGDIVRPHSPSPLRPHSPAFNIVQGDGSAPNSPSVGSPRFLSVSANEFQPRSLVGEFQARKALASPGLSPNPWSPSPLGTPRTASASSGSYFPPIPRDPWQSGEPGSAPSSLPPASNSASSESSADEPLDYDPSSPWQAMNGLPGMGTTPSVEVSGDPFGIDWNIRPQQEDYQPPRSPTPSFYALQETHGVDASYTMTPMDMLCQVFAGTDITPTEVEHALGRNGWDVDRAMEWLVNRPLGTPDPALHGNGGGGAPLSPSLNRHGALGLSPVRPIPVQPRDAFSRLAAPPVSVSPGGSAPGSPRWGSRPGTPSGGAPNPSSYPASAATNRVCRYYLQGSCLRSDCRYNHDISKAVCRFWLRGHCLKGPDRCDFMHHIPTHLTADVALLRLRDRAERAERQQQVQHAHMIDDLFRDDPEDFPTLGQATAGNKGGPRQGPPPASRWSGAVKHGRPLIPSPGPGTSPRPAGVPPSSAGVTRPSTRLSLRPPTLMPTLTTGAGLSDSYANYRSTFIDLGAARAKCLQRAAECWKRGDGAGARTWSREAQDHDVQRLAAGRDAARQILAERKAELKAAVGRDNAREGRVDSGADRIAKGKECGGGMGVLLGVAASAAVTNGSNLSSDERTEAAMDLHGLHAEEAIESLSTFLIGLENEKFLGLAYLFVGQERHTVRHQVRTRLADAVAQHLDEHKYPFRVYAGTVVVDPLSHA